MPLGELLPCPFCGGKPFLVSGRHSHVFCTRCQSSSGFPCGNGAPDTTTPAEAIARWNQRHHWTILNGDEQEPREGYADQHDTANTL